MSVDSKNESAFIIFHGFDPDGIGADGQKGEHLTVAIERLPFWEADTEGTHSAVGGFTKIGEDTVDGARREALEELAGVIDISNNALVPVNEYYAKRNGVHVHVYSCELELEQLRTLQELAAKTDPENSKYDEDYAADFIRKTEQETARVKVIPFEKMLNLPFYEPTAKEDYERVRNSTLSMLHLDHTEADKLFVPNVKPDPESMWVLIPVPAMDSDKGFKPHAKNDERGNPIGITVLGQDRGKPVAVFRNPKDSLDAQHSVQNLPIDGTGVLILPVKKDKVFGNKLLAIGQKLVAKPKLETLDTVLKEIRDAYVREGKEPDMYNSDESQFARMDLKHGTRGSNAGMYSKKSIESAALVVKTENPEDSIAFSSSGKFVGDGKQFGKGQIVLIKDYGRNEVRKMAPDYTEENFVFLDNKPVKLEALPTYELGKDGKLAEVPDGQLLGGTQEIVSPVILHSRG